MKYSPYTTVVAMLFSASAFAHPGPRIWIDTIDGRVTTFTSDNDLSPSIYTPARVFRTELLNIGAFTTSLPGYEVVRTGAHVASGTTYGFNIAGPLLIYDDAADQFQSTQAQFGTPQPGPVPQMAVSHDSEIRISNSRPVNGFNFLTHTGTGDHGHLSYTMVADEAIFDGPNGVYALPMNLTAAALQQSETYLLLLGKNVAPGSPAFDEAETIAHAMIDSPADANLDGRVDATDLGHLALHWQTGASWAGGDFNFDGAVNAYDLLILAMNWQRGVPASVTSPSAPFSVPEPTMLFLPGAMLLARRRAKRH